MLRLLFLFSNFHKFLFCDSLTIAVLNKDREILNNLTCPNQTKWALIHKTKYFFEILLFVLSLYALWKLFRSKQVTIDWMN